MERIQVSLRLFGVFRDLFDEKLISLELQNNSTLSDLKAEIATRLMSSGSSQPSRPASDIHTLIERTAIADESRVLNSGDAITSGMCLAILPPVCGG